MTGSCFRLFLPGRGFSAHQSSLGGAEVVLDRARQHLKVDDHAPVAIGLQARDLAHGSSILAACHKNSASLDQARVTSPIKAGPRLPPAIVVLQARADVHSVHPAPPSLAASLHTHRYV